MKLYGQGKERRRAQAAETNGCQTWPWHAVGHPHRNVKSIAGMIQIHILVAMPFSPNADEVLATVIIKSFTDGAA